jgi:hypothetical protein
MGWKGRISSVPGRTNPAEASGIAFQAPGEIAKLFRDDQPGLSSPRLCNISTSSR